MDSNSSSSRPVLTTMAKSTEKSITSFMIPETNKSGVEYSIIYLSVIASVFLFLMITMALMWLRIHRSLLLAIRRLQEGNQLTTFCPPTEAGALEENSFPEQNPTDTLGQNVLSSSLLNKSPTLPALRSQGRSTQMGSRFNQANLSLHQPIKAGREAMFYKAKVMRGAIKGHNKFTCKIFKNEVNLKQAKREVAVMRKLGTHRNILQLVECDFTKTPYMLLMENVDHGTLRSFLQVNQDSLSKDKEIQHLFTIVAYHIAHAMDHLCSRKIVHCDLALRNIMVHRFPQEIKVAEFGLARDLTCMCCRRSSRNKTYRKRVPLRWYPPEYFKSYDYGFKGDVWSFGILIWEMQTYGTLPYQNLNTSEEVVCYVCAGHRNSEPESCRPEMLQIMRDCWLEAFSKRPSFINIVKLLENTLENDSDYVDLDKINIIAETESGDHSPGTGVYCN